MIKSLLECKTKLEFYNLFSVIGFVLEVVR